MEQGITIIHTNGRKRIWIIFKMIFYFLFYSIIFLFYYLYSRILKSRWSSIRMSVSSFFTSVVILLVWNFFLSLFFVDEVLNDGVSIILSSILSIIILLVFSITFCIIFHIYNKLKFGV